MIVVKSDQSDIKPSFTRRATAMPAENKSSNVIGVDADRRKYLLDWRLLQQRLGCDRTDSDVVLVSAVASNKEKDHCVDDDQSDGPLKKNCRP